MYKEGRDTCAHALLRIYIRASERGYVMHMFTKENHFIDDIILFLCISTFMCSSTSSTSVY